MLTSCPPSTAGHMCPGLQLAEGEDDEGDLRFLVKWQGYEADPDDDGWLYENEMTQVSAVARGPGPGGGAAGAATCGQAGQVRRRQGWLRASRNWQYIGAELHVLLAAARGAAQRKTCVTRTGPPSHLPAPCPACCTTTQCNKLLKEWKRKGRAQWEAARKQLLEEAGLA